MVVKAGKTRIIVTVDANVVEEVRKVLEEIGLPRGYLSTLINDSLKAQRVAISGSRRSSDGGSRNSSERASSRLCCSTC